MSTISSLYSTAAAYPSYPATSQNSSAQALKNLGTALQSGDLSGAQSALVNLQDGLTGDASSSDSSTSDSPDTDSDTDTPAADQPVPFANNSPANSDYKSMVLDLQVGDITAAQKDYERLQTDLKSHGGGGHHHRSGGAAPSSSVDTTASSSTSDATGGSVINVTV